MTNNNKSLWILNRRKTSEWKTKVQAFMN